MKDGWHLIFNEKPDVWGTQHDPATDVAEIPILAGKREGASTKLEAELVELDGRGLLRIAFGSHEWKSEFSVVE